MFVKLCGEWYKLDDFADKHPGGRLVLDSVKGTDATVLFKSLHPFQTTQDMNNMASKFKVPIEQVPKDIINNCPAVPEFLWDTPFQNDLKGLVNGYFESIKAPGQTKRAAAKPSITRKFLLASLFLLRMIVWYYHFTAWSYWTIFVAPAVEWVFSSNIFHDASHSSMSTDPKTNWFLQHVTFFITSPSTWFVQHIIAHHPYTNIAGFDPDLGRPETHKVISEGKKPYGLVTLFMYWTLAQPVLAFIMDPEAWTKKIYNSIVPIMMNPFNGYFAHYLGRFAIWFLWCGWALFFAPTALHSFLWGFVPMIVFSLCFMFCTQLTHMNEVSMGNANQAGAQDWYAHQVITAVNHSLGNPVVSICNASLNYQIEHHLFPTVNHCHLPNLQPGVQEICKKHSVPYTISTISECLTKYWDLMVGF